MANSSSCFQQSSQVNFVNIVQSSTTTEEIIDKAKQEFRKCDSPAERLRYACIATGLSRLKTFLRKLRKNPQISLNDLWQLTQNLALQFTDKDLDSIIEEYSKNGRIDAERLTKDVQVPMNQCRTDLIKQIFNSISKGSNSVDSKTLIRNFSFKNDRDYVSGKKSENQIVELFQRDFNLQEHQDDDDQIDKEDFLNYYGVLSFGANSDAYFDLYMRQTWKF